MAKSAAKAPAKKPIPATDNVVLFETAPNQRGEILRATLSMFKGKAYCRIGKWWTPDAGQTWAPGKGGITLPFDAEGVEQLSSSVEALKTALEVYGA